MLNKQLLFKLKEGGFVLFSFLMVTMSLYHVFFESKPLVLIQHKKTFNDIRDKRDYNLNKLLDELNEKVILSLIHI